MKKNLMYSVTMPAMIAALYVVLSFCVQPFGLASGAIQVRISEALTILPFFTFTAIPGLTIGCLLFNLLSGAAVLDVIFGSLSTFLGAVAAYVLARLIKNRKPLRYLLPIPSILSNAFIIPWVLRTAYGLEDSYWYLVLTVGAGEVISCGILGLILLSALFPFRQMLFLN